MKNRLLSSALLLMLFGQSLLLFAQKNSITVNSDIKLISLHDSVFVHESWIKTDEFGKFPSNGLIIVKNGKALMIDTPYNDELTKQLYDFISDSMHVKVETIIGGHYHPDCIGGLGFLHTKGVVSYSLDITREKCKEFNLPLPGNVFSDSLDLNFHGKKLELRYFGGGHTIDNIVVNIPENKILFGGCLVKSMSSKGLGFTGDAVVDQWEETLRKVGNAFPATETVIPGHGSFGGKELLKHTAELVKKSTKNEK